MCLLNFAYDLLCRTRRTEVRKTQRTEKHTNVKMIHVIEKKASGLIPIRGAIEFLMFSNTVSSLTHISAQ